MNSSNMRPCPGCNGTGQTTYFGGVSRFLLSYEDCPECNGVGFLAQKTDSSLLSEQVAAASGFSLLEADKFLRELAHTLSRVLIQGEAVHLRGFGSFSLSPANTQKKQINFNPGHTLQETLNAPE